MATSHKSAAWLEIGDIHFHPGRFSVKFSPCSHDMQTMKEVVPFAAAIVRTMSRRSSRYSNKTSFQAMADSTSY